MPSMEEVMKRIEELDLREYLTDTLKEKHVSYYSFLPSPPWRDVIKFCDYLEENGEEIVTFLPILLPVSPREIAYTIFTRNKQ